MDSLVETWGSRCRAVESWHSEGQGRRLPTVPRDTELSSDLRDRERTKGSRARGMSLVETERSSSHRRPSGSVTTGAHRRRRHDRHLLGHRSGIGDYLTRTDGDINRLRAVGSVHSWPGGTTRACSAIRDVFGYGERFEYSMVVTSCSR